MEKKSKFFKAYFILAIIYGIIGLLDALVFSGTKETFGQIPLTWIIFTGIFAVAIFILSIIALVIFIKNKFAKITWIMPIYHLILPILILVIGIFWGIFAFTQGKTTNDIFVTPGLTYFGIITSLFELLFSIYILSKFR